MSYIPRSSLINAETQSAIPMQVKRRHTVRMFNVITTIILVLSLLGTVGIFLYKDYVEGELDSARVALDKISSSRGGENVKKIEEIRLYDNKLTIARTLIDNHLSPSMLLQELENSTKETVQFNLFEYTYDPGYEVIVTLGGNTKEISSVALQKMQILRDGMFSEFVVSDITTAGGVNKQDQGKPASVGLNTADDPKVEFQVKGVFAKKLLEYKGVTDTSSQSSTEESAFMQPDTSADTDSTNKSLTSDNI